MHDKPTKLFTVFAMVIIPVLVVFSAAMIQGSNLPDDVAAGGDPFIRSCITRNAAQIGDSSQLVFATNKNPSSYHVTIRLVEKNRDAWRLSFRGFAGTVGKKGFAHAGDKREGDGRSPSGIFPLGTVFGYSSSLATKMPYRQATAEDYWVDDVDSEDYNKWIRGKPNAASWERMRRDDDQYKYGVVIEYNTHPVIKGMGSAIFLHVWKDGQATAGCVAMPEERVVEILAWLDPAKKPLIIMGVEDQLTAGSGPPAEIKRTENPARRTDDLVDVKEINPRIVVDMKYATKENFTGKKLYDSNSCFLRPSTALKLSTVQRELEKMQLGVKVWDCYRPLSVQKILWNIFPDERYVANPKTGSRHNRGSAVDATLVDRSGNELLMPTAFDDFTPRAHHKYQDLDKEVIRNRALLEGLMKKVGFIPLPEEWWHYDDENWMDFGIIDVPFEKLLLH